MGEEEREKKRERDNIVIINHAVGRARHGTPASHTGRATLSACSARLPSVVSSFCSGFLEHTHTRTYTKIPSPTKSVEANNVWKRALEKRSKVSAHTPLCVVMESVAVATSCSCVVVSIVFDLIAPRGGKSISDNRAQWQRERERGYYVILSIVLMLLSLR